MTRWWPVGVALLLMGGAVTVAVMRPTRESALRAEFQPDAIKQYDLTSGQHAPQPTLYDPVTRQPKDEGLYALQWLADGVRCPVTDNVSLMASCVLQRYGKMRDKALSARARYDALVGLERAYWANLAREGLTQKIEHVNTR